MSSWIRWKWWVMSGGDCGGLVRLQLPDGGVWSHGINTSIQIVMNYIEEKSS